MVGNGYVSKIMPEDEAVSLIKEALAKENWSGKRVLLILPDMTRSAPIPLLYKTIYDCISDDVQCLDGLIALGTHQAMSLEKFLNV